MELNDKVIREISAIVVVLIFAVLVFFAIKPLIFSVIWGLLFAYAFFPAYSKINYYTKNRTLSASLTLVLAILLILIPLWIITPLIVNQLFEIFRFSQFLDMTSFVQSLFPTASQQFTLQLSTTINALIGKGTVAVTGYLTGIFVNLPLLLVNLFVIGFVFFFTLRDIEKLREFMRGISPLSKSKEKIVVKHFKDITYSIVFGHVVVGVVQGILAGIGFFIFGVKGALVLSVLAILLCVLPIVGVFLLWIPIAVLMFASGKVAIAIAFIAYNLLIVSNIDNILLAYIVSKRTNLSPVFALVSSVGGLFLFGVIGLILGPLIFAYFIIMLDLYREKNLLSLFASDEEVVVKEEVKKPEAK